MERSFTLARSHTNALSLRFNSRLFPVNPDFLKEMLKEKASIGEEITVACGEEVRVGVAFVWDAIEEALGSLGQAIAAAQSDKNHLLSLCLEMDDPLGPTRPVPVLKPFASEAA